jgi:hypothetical protein
LHAVLEATVPKPMSEQKPSPFRTPLYHRPAGDRRGKPAQSESAQTRTSEKQGWDAYRKWLTRVGGGKPATERAPLDPSIYSWKGYQNWADKVREAWKVEEN